MGLGSVLLCYEFPLMTKLCLSLGLQVKSLLNFWVLTEVWHEIVDGVSLGSIFWVNVLPLVTCNLLGKVSVLQGGLNASVQAEVWHEVVDLVGFGVLWLPGEEWLSGDIKLYVLIGFRVIIGVAIVVGLDHPVKERLGIPLRVSMLLFGVLDVRLGSKDVGI